MTNTLYIIGSILSGGVITGMFTIAYKVGQMTQAITELSQRMDRHEMYHNRVVPGPYIQVDTPEGSTI